MKVEAHYVSKLALNLLPQFGYFFMDKGTIGRYMSIFSRNHHYPERTNKPWNTKLTLVMSTKRFTMQYSPAYESNASVDFTRLLKYYFANQLHQYRFTAGWFVDFFRNILIISQLPKYFCTVVLNDQTCKFPNRFPMESKKPEINDNIRVSQQKIPLRLVNASHTSTIRTSSSF